MCWYSADHAANVSQAEAGQRLGIRKVHGSNWAVSESDLHKQSPAPVCLIDNTRVLFRFSELQKPALDMEAVFRMRTDTKRDVVLYPDGREIAFESLPENLVFDVLAVPGKEDLSAPLKPDHRPTTVAEPSSRLESQLARVF
jgi:hypothetical protein